MLRIGLVIIFAAMLLSCTTVKVQDAEKASDLNAELGLAYLQKGRYDQSLVKLRKSISLNPDNATAYLYMAELYRQLDENEMAEKYFNKAINKDPENSSINNNYGAFLCANKDFEKAFKYFDIALENPVYRDRAKVFENIGLCSQEKGNIKVARDNYIEAIRLNPNLGTSLLAVAQLDFDNQNIKSAAKYYKYYSRVARQTSESLWLGILIARKQSDTKAVGSLSWSLERKYPKSKETKWLKRLKTSGAL